jgi:long-chain acyl-CoA synthetase
VGTSSTNPEKPWLAHYQSGVPEHFDYEIKCLPDFLERSVERFPGKMALNFQGFEITYKQLQDMVERFAACLHHFGVRQGDAVALLLPNVIPCVAAYYAAMRIGAVAVMNNPLYSDRELEHQFNDSGAKLLITLDLLGNRMIDLRPKTSIKQIIYTSIGDYLPFPKNLLFRWWPKRKSWPPRVKPADDVYRWKPSWPRATPDAAQSRAYPFDDVAMYQYTGGTTGVSKGVMLTHGNLSKQVQQLRAWFPTFNRGEEIMLGALPFFHVFGLSTAMNLAIYMGWGNILVPKPQPDSCWRPSPSSNPPLRRWCPPCTSACSASRHQKVDMTSIKGCFSGSAPLPVEVIREFEKRPAPSSSKATV